MSKYYKAEDVISFLNTNCPKDMWEYQIADLPTIEVEEKEKALRLLLDWAVECGFGYDNIPEEYERYKHEIEDMNYTEGLIYIAEREVCKE